MDLDIECAGNTRRKARIMYTGMCVETYFIGYGSVLEESYGMLIFILNFEFVLNVCFNLSCKTMSKYLWLCYKSKRQQTKKRKEKKRKAMENSCTV